MRRLLQTCVLLLLIPASALAANHPHTTLDTASSSVAGKPLTVWCEMDGGEWERQLNEAGMHGWESAGYTYPDEPITYLSPHICATLHTLRNVGIEQLGSYWASKALSTLAHEAIHQTGELDECKTNGAALGHVRRLAVEYFNVPETVVELREKKRWRTITRKVRGNTVRFRIRESYVAKVRVPNPLLRHLDRQALGWHVSTFVRGGYC